jgi:hypothetical protein
MEFLISGGGYPGDKQFLNLSSGNAITGQFAVDNGCYSGPFSAKKLSAYLKKVEPYKEQCLFVVMPDAMCDPDATMALWRQWYPAYSGWPLAFVAQDGQENRPYPPDAQWTTLFIGGSTDWKLSTGAITCIQYAQALGKRVHVGRVNSYKRYTHFAALPGADQFTCDGTKQRFIGKEKAHAHYRGIEQKYRSRHGISYGGGGS